MPEKVEQRLAAILAADVAGYTRLMADDERATIETIADYRRRFRSHIEASGGRVVDMAGDSVLAIFATASGAVTAAVATQREFAAVNAELPAVRAMHFRIGVNVGEIHEHDDGTVYGDGVNVAARLEGLAEPGGVMLSEDAWRQVRRISALAFADAGEHKVKNIAEPVRAYRYLADSVGTDLLTSAQQGRLLRNGRLIGAAAGLALLIGAGALWLGLQERDTPPTPQMATFDDDPTDDPILAMPAGPSIAVLPFENLSEDVADNVFADGITEDIITRLSLFPDYLVIARNTSFQFKDRTADAVQVARELNVEFVLEGRVRRGGNKIRLTTQLIDGRSGAQVWGETFDADLTTGNIFDIQDAITERVTATLADSYGIISQSGYEHSLTRDVADLSEYECVLGAHGYYASNFTAAAHARVRDCLEAAVAASPNYADAWAWLAAMYRDELMAGHNSQPNSLSRAEDAARTAITLEPSNQQGHLVLAHVYLFRGDIPGFVTAARRTVSINPNSADALASMGMAMGFVGHWDEGLAWTSKAMKLNPRFPPWFHWVYYFDHYRKGEYEEAARHADSGVIPGFFWPYAMQAAAYARLHKKTEARTAINALMDTTTNIGVTELIEHHKKWNFSKPLIESFMDGLRLAGLPDDTKMAP